MKARAASWRAGSAALMGTKYEPPWETCQEAVADQRALVANYYRLGRVGDRRNLPLLRAALRTEHDPAVRMAAAEAIYLSDPDSDAARRTFLESLDPAALGPLRALAAPDPTGPVLGSLADLAAEGDLDALSRLVEISPAAAGDPGLWELLSSLWEEVGRGVPEQAMAALRSSAPAASDAALAAMARGIAHASEPEHPFVAAARGAALASDPAAAAFGSALARQLDERIAAARSMQAAPPAIMGPGKPAAPGTGAGG